jgi:hypothetical protein
MNTDPQPRLQGPDPEQDIRIQIHNSKVDKSSVFMIPLMTGTWRRWQLTRPSACPAGGWGLTTRRSRGTQAAYMSTMPRSHRITSFKDKVPRDFFCLPVFFLVLKQVQLNAYASVFDFELLKNLLCYRSFFLFKFLNVACCACCFCPSISLWFNNENILAIWYDFDNVDNFLLCTMFSAIPDTVRCSVMNLVLEPNPGTEPGSSLKNYA